MTLSDDQVILIERYLQVLEDYIMQRNHKLTKTQCKAIFVSLRKKLELGFGTGEDAETSRIAKLENAIRSHRDARGDDRCWRDDEELYKMLPEGYTPPERDSSVELERCKQFIESRHNPATIYVSPEREIERLKRELDSSRLKLIEKNQFQSET